jgi:DedD protein
VKPPAESPLLKLPAESAALKKNAEGVPSAKSEPAPGRDVPEPPAGSAQYVLQIGAFQRTDKAEQVVAELRNAGYTAYTDTIIVPGKGTLVRVRMGSFHNVAEARRKAAEVQSKTKIPVLISKK